MMTRDMKQVERKSSMQPGDIVRVRAGVIWEGEVGVVIRSSMVYTIVYFQHLGATCAYFHHNLQRVRATEGAAS